MVIKLLVEVSNGSLICIALTFLPISSEFMKGNPICAKQ